MYRTDEADVAIVGAGISGLAAGYYMTQRGLNVQILESGNRCGGVIQSTFSGGFLHESGPNSVLDKSGRVSELVRELNLAAKVLPARPASRFRYILRDGRLTPLPMSPLSFITSRAFSARAKMRLLGEPFIGAYRGEDEETIAQFVERRLGREFLDYAVNPFIAGVYAGNPEELSVKSCLPRLHALEARYGGLVRGTVRGRKQRMTPLKLERIKGIFSFTTGMNGLIGGLATVLRSHTRLEIRQLDIRRATGGFRLEYTSNGERQSTRARQILFTVPSHAYGRIRLPAGEPLQSILSGIRYAPVAVVFTGFQDFRNGPELDGFGFLVPGIEKRRVLGTVFNSALFPGRSPASGAGLTTFVGGARDPQFALLPKDELVALVLSELKAILGIEQQPDFIAVHQYRNAIPQYGLDHSAIMNKLKSLEAREPGLHIGGNFRGGVSVSDCIDQGWNWAHTIGSQLDSAPRRRAARTARETAAES